MIQLSNLLVLLGLILSLGSRAQNSTEPSKLFVIPPYFIANAECYIQGPFDGDGSNTSIWFENNYQQTFPIKPIIEGEGKILVKVPDSFGEYELIIVEEGNNLSLFVPVRIIHFETQYDNKSCQIKEAFDFQINLLGAEEMEEEFVVTIDNRTPHVVSVVGGNHQQHTIIRTKESDEILWKGQMVAIDRSDFMVWTTLTQPIPSVEFPAN